MQLFASVRKDDHTGTVLYENRLRMSSIYHDEYFCARSFKFPESYRTFGCRTLCPTLFRATATLAQDRRFDMFLYGVRLPLVVSLSDPLEFGRDTCEMSFGSVVVEYNDPFPWFENLRS